MSDLIQVIVLALPIGSAYALIALGLTLTFKVTNVINFAYGSLATLGAYVMLSLTAGDSGGLVLTWFASYPAWLGLAGAVVFGAVLGALLYTVLIGRAREATSLSLGVVTIGLFLAFQMATVYIWTDTNYRLVSPFPRGTISIGETVMSYHQIGMIVTVIILSVGFWLWFTRTRVGIAARASTEDPMAAGLVGIEVRRIARLIWAVSGAIACLGGALIGHLLTLQPGALGGLLTKAVAAAIVGGFVSLPLAALGGFFIAFLEGLLVHLGAPAGFPDSVVMAVIVLALLLNARRGHRGYFARQEALT